MPFCTQCGNRNPDDAKFCAQCGSRLVAPEGAGGGVSSGSQVSADDTTTTPAIDATATVTFGVPAGAETTEGDEKASLAAADAAVVDALPQGSALLVVQRGPGAGNRFLLDSELVTTGRHPDSEIFLDDITVSRRHVEFTRDESGYAVRDVGSLNGTYVNRNRIEQAELHNGDEVQIGKFRLVFFTGDEHAE